MSIFQESFDKLRKATNDRQSIIKWIRDNTYVNESTTVDGVTTGYSAYFGYDLCFFMVYSGEQKRDASLTMDRFYGDYKYKGNGNTTDMWLTMHSDMKETLIKFETTDLYKIYSRNASGYGFMVDNSESCMFEVLATVSGNLDEYEEYDDVVLESVDVQITMSLLKDIVLKLEDWGSERCVLDNCRPLDMLVCPSCKREIRRCEDLISVCAYCYDKPVHIDQEISWEEQEYLDEQDHMNEIEYREQESHHKRFMVEAYHCV